MTLLKTERQVDTPSRNAVGVYDRPHPLRRRKVLAPAVVAVAVGVVYGLWAYFT